VDVLNTITVISLYLLRDVLPLFWRTKANKTAKTRVGLLVSVCNTHSTTNRDVEAFELPVLIKDDDETKVIGKDVYIVGWPNRYCNFELGRS
jgi:hypothetical protein